MRKQMIQTVTVLVLVVIGLGRLAPADGGLVLGLLRQHRLVVWIGSHNPIISRLRT